MNIPLLDPNTNERAKVFTEDEFAKGIADGVKVNKDECTELTLYDYKIVCQFEIHMPEWQHNISKARELIQAYIDDGMPTPDPDKTWTPGEDTTADKGNTSSCDELLAAVTSYCGCGPATLSTSTWKGTTKSQTLGDDEGKARAKVAAEEAEKIE